VAEQIAALFLNGHAGGVVGGLGIADFEFYPQLTGVKTM